MTSTAFTSLLRFLVLVGLFLASSVHASTGRVCTGSYGTITQTGNNPTDINSQITSQLFLSTSPYSSGLATHAGVITRSQIDSSTYQFTTERLNNSNNEYAGAFSVSITCGCDTSTGVITDATSLVVVLPNSCRNFCRIDPNGSGFQTVGPVVNGSASTFFNSPFIQTGATCIPEICDGGKVLNDAGSCVIPPPPTCSPPQVLNAAKTACETPACPVGQTRVAAGAACTPIVCTPPMVKVGSQCEIPQCPVGQSYQYINGSGSCIKEPTPCVPPQTMINGACRTPICAAGLIISPSGQCVLDTSTNGTAGSSSSGTGSTGSGSTGTGSTGSGSTGTGSTAATSGTDGKGGSSTGTGSASGNNTNSAGSGTCTTPPCGECDPSKESCGNSFGGSCKSNFQCNGDAIQCAVASATNKAECLLKSLYVDEENNPTLEAGKAALAQGTKALGTEGGLPVTEKSISALNRDNPFSSTCPADYPMFSYKGQSYMLPLSNYCNVFQLMGQIMLVIAGLVSASIVLKGL